MQSPLYAGRNELGSLHDAVEAFLCGLLHHVGFAGLVYSAAVYP